MATSKSLTRINAIETAVKTFLSTDATYADWSVVKTFAQNSLDDILESAGVKDSSIFINYGSADTMQYEGGSVGLGKNRYSIYLVTTELKGSDLPEKLIVTTDEFIGNIHKYLKGFYFGSYDNNIKSGNICYTEIRIDY